MTELDGLASPVPYYEEDKYRFTAPIKADYVIWDRVLATPLDLVDDDAAEGREPEQKRQKTGHKKQRGQNKARSFQIARDSVPLCHFTARERDCTREKCRFEHDVKTYLAAKERDVETNSTSEAGETVHRMQTCPVFAETGACCYGYKCRFLDSHVDLLPEGQGFQGSGLRLRWGNEAAKLDEDRLNQLLDTKGELNVVRGDTRGKFRPSNMPNALPASHAYLTSIGATLDDLIESKKHQNPGDRRHRYANGSKPMSRPSPAVSIPAEAQERKFGQSGGTTVSSSPDDDDKPALVETQPPAAENGVDVCPPGNTQATHEHSAKGKESSKCVSGIHHAPDVPMRAVEKRRLDFRGRYYLAPLTTVGNLPFRRLCGEYGSDVHCGEMGLASEYLSGNPSEWALLRRHASEKMFGVQVCGSRPHQLVPVAEAIIKTSPDVDFVDVNCGCPIDLIVQKGAGSALLDHPAKLGKSLVGMSRVLGEIPLTCKLRIGVRDKDQVAHKLVERVRDWGLSSVTLHGRSRQQRYSRMADYQYIKTCVESLRAACEDDGLPRVPFVGNGDAYDFREFWENIENTGVDTIMVARGALVKPWIFTELRERRDWDISARERLDGIGKLANYGLAHWGTDTQGISTTRRFLCEALSFQHRYVPVGLLERLPARLNERPLPYRGRDELETLLSSGSANDWDKIATMFLGPPPAGWRFTPKHKSNAYEAG